MFRLILALAFALGLSSAQAQLGQVPIFVTPTNSGVSEVQALGTQIGVGLSDTGAAGTGNLAYSTQVFNSPDWSPNNITAADNQTAAPDSTTTAAAITETATTGVHSAGQGFLKAASGVQYAVSFSLKQGLRTRATIAVADSSNANGAYSVFDLAGGVVGVAGTTFGTGFSIVAVNAPTPQSNGFYLCTIVITTNSNGYVDFFVEGDAGSGTGAISNNYAGNASSPAFYVWGATINQAASPSAYSLVTNGGLAASSLTGTSNTTWWGTQTANAWAGVDAGVPVTWTRYRFAPRQGNTGNLPLPALDYESYMQGSLAQNSSSATFASGNTTVDTIPATPYYPRYQLNERSLSGINRYVRLLPQSGAYGSIAQLQFFAQETAGITAAAPVAPVVAPWGGLFPAGSATIALTSRTNGASIYYTADGSTPTNSHGTLYGGAFSLSLSGTVTLKAVSYKASLSTPLSPVQTAVFEGNGFAPNDNWYDTSGNLIEAHDGGVFWDASTSLYYWVGHLMNKATIPETNFNTIRKDIGPMLYSSPTLYPPWTLVGNILPMPPGNSSNGLPWISATRPHILFNASTSKYVLWTHISDGSFNGTDRAAIATSSALAGPWTWVTIGLNPDGIGFKDCNLFLDNDGVTAYVVYTIGTQNGVQISQLSSNYLTTDGSTVAVGTGNREAPTLFKVGSVYFLITSVGNGYSSAAEMDLRYDTTSAGNPLSGWGTFPGSALFASDPIGGNYNGQSTSVLQPQNGGQLFLATDFWTSAALYNSRYTWVPLTVSGGNTVAAGEPAFWTIGANPTIAFSSLASGNVSSTVAGSGTYTAAAPSGLTSATWGGGCSGGSTVSGFSAGGGTWSATFTTPSGAGTGCTLAVTGTGANTASATSSGVTISGPAISFSSLASGGTVGGSPIAGSGTYTLAAPSGLTSASWGGGCSGATTVSGFSAGSGTWSANFSVPAAPGTSCTITATGTGSNTATATSPGVTISAPLVFSSLANGTVGGSPIAGSGTYTGTAPASITSASWTGCGGGSSTPSGFSAGGGTWSATFTVPGSSGSGCTIFITDDRSDTATSPGVTISGGGITIDGQAASNNQSGGSAATVTLSTTQTNDVIVVFLAYNGGGSGTPTFSISDTAGLTWTQRAITHDASTPTQPEVEFWAPSTGILTSDVITMTASQTKTFASATAFGVHGATSIATPFDTNVSLPALEPSPTTTTSVSTTASTTLIFGSYRMIATQNPTAGATWTAITGSNTGVAFHIVEYENFSGAQTSLAIPLTTGAGNQSSGIGDAIH